jgi:dihydrolipoamide dehydrogenase
MAYDVVVIGSGPGGYSTAVRAGQYGLKTALVEKDPKLGGCCLLVGCIPTKALLHSAGVWDHFVHAEAEGVVCDTPPRLNYPVIAKRKQTIVEKHSKGVDFLMKKNKVDVIKGYAKLAGRGRLEVQTADGIKTTSSWRRVRKRACCPVLRPIRSASLRIAKSWT